MVRVCVRVRVGARARVLVGLLRCYIRVNFEFRVTIRVSSLRVSVGLMLGLLLWLW